MKTMHSILVAALALTMSATAVPAADQDAGPGAPVVVELFTSQGCYSCPPAEKFLGDLAGQKSVLALEFHVDYWDDLVHGADGKWKDVFSKPQYTARQRGYNERIRGRGNVYTPQMVIDGKLEAVGSRRLAVLSAIRRAETARRDRVAVDVTLDSGTVQKIRLGGAVKSAGSVWLVRFIESRETRVRSGENKGKALLSHNVVTEMRKIGAWSGRAATIDVKGFTLADGEGCAVLVQDDRQGPVLGAAPCPSGTS